MLRVRHDDDYLLARGFERRVFLVLNEWLLPWLTGYNGRRSRPDLWRSGMLLLTAFAVASLAVGPWVGYWVMIIIAWGLVAVTRIGSLLLDRESKRLRAEILLCEARAIVNSLWRTP